MNGDGTEPHNKKRKGFQLSRSCPPNYKGNLPAVKIWKCRDPVRFCCGPTPLVIHERLANAVLIFAFDCETHELIPEHSSQWTTTRFGFKAQVDEQVVRHLRLVQLGWACGNIAWSKPSVHQHLIKPEGFDISPGASHKHKITNCAASTDGELLRDVLCRLVGEASACCDAGGRMAAHHLGFDSIIIFYELHRAGLDHLQDKWADIVRHGFCTMDPDVACWVRDGAGLRDKSGRVISWGNPIGLKDLLSLLAPQYNNLHARHHTADVDAKMCWLICQESLRLAGLLGDRTEPPCTSHVGF